MLEVYRSCVMSKRSLEQGLVRAAADAKHNQKDRYKNILTLNVGHVNHVPVIAGHKKFPKHICDSSEGVTLPYLVFRHGAHNIVALVEASDTKGGIAIHQHLLRGNAMIGILVDAETSAPSLACFIRALR